MAGIPNFKGGIEIIMAFVVMFVMALIIISLTLNQRLKELELKGAEIEMLKKQMDNLQMENTEIKEDLKIILFGLYYGEDSAEKEIEIEDLFKNNEIENE